MSLKKIVLIASLALAAQVHAQTMGTLVTVPAVGEVSHVNDEATVSFSVIEQDKDKAAAAARVNKRIKQGTDIVRRQDPGATLKTQNYQTYPVYPEERPLPNGMPSTKIRMPTGWRIEQHVELTTTSIGSLPALAAAVQKVMDVSGVEFGLSPATTKALDEQRIAATYRNLNERIAMIAATMGRKVGDSTLEALEFAPAQREAAMMAGYRSRMLARESAEPSFEPGETTLQMSVVGKVRFK